MEPTKPTIGRPKSENPRGKAVPVRFTADERAAVQAAADAAGLSLSAWVRERAVASARRAAARAKPEEESAAQPDT